MNKLLEITLLYDFYGELLTPHQQNIYELYYQNDLSLGEISKNLKISRQGVYDTLKRCEKSLYEYEERLQLLQRFRTQKKLAEKILISTERIKKHLIKEDHFTNEYLLEIQNIEKIINQILEQ